MRLGCLLVLFAFCAVSCSHEKSSKTDTETNKRIVENLLSKALPNGDLDFIKKVVSPNCITHRAGFAALYEATSDVIPQKGNFLEWDYQIVDHSGNIIGLINKEIFHMSDTYSLTIEHDEDAFYVLMIVLAIDAQKCSQNK